MKESKFKKIVGKCNVNENAINVRIAELREDIAHLEMQKEVIRLEIAKAYEQRD